MSQLGNLKLSIDAIAQQAGAMSGNLGVFRQQFNTAAAHVQATIGGSAQGKDSQLLDVIASAQRQVDQAAAALMQASTSARQYGESL
jgi:hypothetical protein